MNNSRLKQHLISLYEYLYAKTLVFRIRHKYPLHIMSARKTIDYILKNACSVSRFGEGEFNIMFWTSKIKFQQQDDLLATRMRELLCKNNPNLLLCVPRTIITDRGYVKQAKHWWREWSKQKQKYIVPAITERTGRRYLFGDALFTRPYMDFASVKHAKKTFSSLKKLWDNRDLLIVEGNRTCLGIGNDLFDNASSIKRILAPAENAFSCYDKILSTVKELHNGELILIALGPTATVLAGDLASETCQAIDIGHIDIEYEWYLMGAKSKVQIPGKYTNEAMREELPPLCADPVYLSQIVCRIE